MKKIISTLLCCAMLLGLVACGSDDNQSSQGTNNVENNQTNQETNGTENGTTGAGEINFDEDPYTIHVCYAVLGEAQPDLPLIQEKLNEITLREINATVELEAINISSLANTYALKASGQEKMDLMILFPGYIYLSTFVNSNLLLPVEDLVEQWGPNIQEVVGHMLPAGEYKGHLYGIPQNRGIRTNGYGFKLSAALCEKYNIDVNAIQTLEDLDDIFAMIKEAEPNITVIMPETLGTGIGVALNPYQDTLGSGGGVLSVEEDGSLKVVNSLEYQETMDRYKKVHEWYEKGYISKDVLTSQDDGVVALTAGKCFAMASIAIEPGAGSQDYLNVVINHEKPLVATSADQLIMWGIPNTCERPEKAIQFLDLCFGSEEITNLMQFGVEDVHYTVVQEGVVDNSNNANWLNVWPMFGDNRKTYIAYGTLTSTPGVETAEDYRAILQKWEEEESPAYGFMFDPTDVRTEIAACDAVDAEYSQALLNGTVDPEEELPKYIQKLYDSGLQKVIDEKQRQLDEWVASNK